MNTALAIVVLGGILLLAHLFAEIFSRTRIPDVLWLILIGLAFGPLAHIITPDDFGVVGPIFITVTLVIILFQSGLGLSLGTLRKSLRGAVALSIISFILSMVVVGLVIWQLTNLGLLSGFILGAIVAGTTSAIVIPTIRQLRMHDNSKAMLLLESALTDVMCIVVTLALVHVYKSSGVNFGLELGRTVASFLVAGLLGTAGALIWSILLKRIRALQDAILMTPAFVFIIFGSTELMGFSGYIAALAFGIVLGNAKLFWLPLRKVKPFRIPWRKRHLRFEMTGIDEYALNPVELTLFSEIAFLLKTFFFVYLGLSIQLANSWWLLLGLILTAIIFAVRVPVVRYSVSKTIPKEDASLIAVLIPRGLAAAVLALVPLREGVAGGDLIQSATFSVVLSSIVLMSILVFLLQNTPLSRFYGWIFSGFAASLEPVSEPSEVNDQTTKEGQDRQ
jgi:cell volume regulation protein A